MSGWFMIWWLISSWYDGLEYQVMVIPINGVWDSYRNIQASFLLMILIYLCYSRSQNRICSIIPYLNINQLNIYFYWFLQFNNCGWIMVCCVSCDWYLMVLLRCLYLSLYWYCYPICYLMLSDYWLLEGDLKCTSCLSQTTSSKYEYSYKNQD